MKNGGQFIHLGTVKLRLSKYMSALEYATTSGGYNNNASATFLRRNKWWCG